MLMKHRTTKASDIIYMAKIDKPVRFQTPWGRHVIVFFHLVILSRLFVQRDFDKDVMKLPVGLYVGRPAHRCLQVNRWLSDPGASLSAGSSTHNYAAVHILLILICDSKTKIKCNIPWNNIPSDNKQTETWTMTGTGEHILSCEITRL